MEIFENIDACVMPVKNFSESCKDPQIRERKMVKKLKHPKFGEVKNVASPINYSRTPLSIRSLAPKLGQHTKEILKTLGYTDEETRSFKRNGVI